MYTGDTKYDVIILGCGIAGSTLGYLLKKSGYRVLILESRKYKGKSKLCGGIITKRSYEILKKIYDIDALEKYAIIEHLHSLTIKSVFTATIKNIDIKIANRKRLDIYLANQYVKSGGDLLEECGPLEYDLKNKKIKSGMFTFSYDILVGADGVVSMLRKTLTGKYQDRYVSMQYVTKPATSQIIIKFKKGFIGYYWYIATQAKTLIGCGDFKKYRKYIPEFKNAKVNKDEIIGEIVSGIRPTGKKIMLKSTSYNDVYFIGDAAGLTSPLTGEGIYHALNSANNLFKSILDKQSYEKLMNSTIIDIKKELIYRNRMYNYIHRTIVVFILSRKGPFARSYIKRIKKMYHID